MNQYYEKVDELYREYRSGALTTEQTIERKRDLFDELLKSCSAIAPAPVSFNKCPASMNNAGLAFDRTYTAHYPMLHDLSGSPGPSDDERLRMRVEPADERPNQRRAGRKDGRAVGLGLLNDHGSERG